MLSNRYNFQSRIRDVIKQGNWQKDFVVLSLPNNAHRTRARKVERHIASGSGYRTHPVMAARITYGRNVLRITWRGPFKAIAATAGSVFTIMREKRCFLIITLIRLLCRRRYCMMLIANLMAKIKKLRRRWLKSEFLLGKTLIQGRKA